MSVNKQWRCTKVWLYRSNIKVMSYKCTAYWSTFNYLSFDLTLHCAVQDVSMKYFFLLPERSSWHGADFSSGQNGSSRPRWGLKIWIFVSNQCFIWTSNLKLLDTCVFRGGLSFLVSWRIVNKELYVLFPSPPTYVFPSSFRKSFFSFFVSSDIVSVFFLFLFVLLLFEYLICFLPSFLCRIFVLAF